MERCRRKIFISGEDLTCQAGLGVQQDLALGALIGVTHAERNGHHYVDGLAIRRLPRRRRSCQRIPTLRQRRKQDPAVHPRRRSLDGIAGTPGFATSVIRLVGIIAACAANNKNLQSKYYDAKRLGVIMNGVTGRMGLNQHLIRSIIAIRDSGGVCSAMATA